MEIPKAINRHAAMLALVALLLLGIGWRLVPHVPNFAPIGAIALFAGQWLGWRKSLLVTLVILAVSDAMIGFYPGVQWTWLGFGLIATFGYFTSNLPLGWRVPVGALGASTLFFIVSNFGTWVSSGMYSPSLAGLIECYVMALPFLRATLLSDVIFTAALLGTHETVAILSRRPAAPSLRSKLV